MVEAKFVNALDSILNQYTQLRNSGVEAKEALRRLRPAIEPLARDARDRLAASIRSYEAEESVPSTAPTPPQAGHTHTLSSYDDAVGRMNPLQAPPPAPIPTASSGLRSLSASETQPKLDRLICWNCGKLNRTGEVFCVHCGVNLQKNKPESGSTKQLTVIDEQTSGELFNQHSALYFRVRHTGDVLRIRPQDAPHEIVVGRRDDKGIVIPDIDLSPYGASGMGVSRMHMVIRYDRQQERLLIADMNSANGSYVNVQRMAAQEVRVLRTSDQIRLAQLVLDVAYQQE